MTIDGQIEGIEKKTKEGTCEPYMRVRMKGRTFITFDTGLLNDLPDLNGTYVRIDYSFFKGNEFPNVYRLNAITKT